jgi:pSer/pThr/pTyr-binding forkhead associated (FHA) protein
VNKDQQKDVWDIVSEHPVKAPFGIRVTLRKDILKIIRLDPSITYIGRMPENHIVLDDEKASRSHARIVQQSGDYFVEDQESENGIYVNGVPIQRAKLTVGDQILIGNHILEVISADENIQPVLREEQIDLSTDEDWRLDDTVSIKRAEDVSPKNELPKLHLTLKLGNEVIIRDVVFDKGRKLKESSQDNLMHVVLKIGRWVLEKKIPL